MIRDQNFLKYNNLIDKLLINVENHRVLMILPKFFLFKISFASKTKITQPFFLTREKSLNSKLLNTFRLKDPL
jgi:hypothetical protein